MPGTSDSTRATPAEMCSEQKRPQKGHSTGREKVRISFWCACNVLAHCARSVLHTWLPGIISSHQTHMGVLPANVLSMRNAGARISCANPTQSMVP